MKIKQKERVEFFVIQLLILLKFKKICHKQEEKVFLMLDYHNINLYL